MHPRNGLVEIVAGAGGHSLYGLRRRYPGLAFANRTEFGAVRLDLSPGRANVSFVGLGGRRLVNRTVRCRPGGR